MTRSLARMTLSPAVLLAGTVLVLAPAWARDGVRSVGDPARTVEVPPPGPAGREPALRSEAGYLSVVVDRAKVIRLPERTQTVVVGNPAIADMALQKNGVVVLTGKSFGVTNLIALDAAGNLLAESMLSVSAPTDGLVIVQRGQERQSYACDPACHPSVVLGDSTKFFDENRTQADNRNTFATSR